MHVACGAMGHDQGRVCHPLTTGSESRACKSTPPFAHRPRPTGVPRMRATRRPVRPRLTLTPASPSAAEPTGRHPHRSPRPYLVALIGHTRPSSPPLSTKLPPSSLTVRPAPRTRRVVPLPAWGRRPPPSHTGAGPNRMLIKMCRCRGPATAALEARTNIRPSPPRGGGAARPPVRGRAHTDRSSRPSRLPISCWLAGVRRGVGGRGCGPGSCG